MLRQHFSVLPKKLCLDFYFFAGGYVSIIARAILLLSPMAVPLVGWSNNTRLRGLVSWERFEKVLWIGTNRFYKLLGGFFSYLFLVCFLYQCSLVFLDFFLFFFFKYALKIFRIHI